MMVIGAIGVVAIVALAAVALRQRREIARLRTALTLAILGDMARVHLLAGAGDAGGARKAKYWETLLGGDVAGHG